MSLYLGKSPIGKVSVSFEGSGGENTYDATLTSGNQMLEGVTAYSKGQKYTGRIPSKTSNDVEVNGNEVLIPNGYYSDNVRKSVETTDVAIPSIEVSNNGLITAITNQGTGYVVGETKSTNKQLNTKGATTITPTSSVQTVVSAGTYVTGDIKVDAYEIPDVENGILATPTINTSNGIVTSSVSKSGYISDDITTTLQLATKGAATITPSETQQTINANQYLTGVQTIEAIPSTYIGSAVETQNYYVGDSEPSSSVGSDGDLYFVRG